MFTIRYTYEIVKTVEDTLVIFELDKNNYRWYPKLFMLFSLIFGIVAMPLILPEILAKERFSIIKKQSAEILEKDFGFIKK